MYNEEKLILNTLQKVTSYFDKKKYNYEIIVVDDKSKDKSVNMVSKFNHSKIKIIKKKKNEGKGSAVKVGVLNASKDFIGFMDADLPYALDNLDAMIQELEKYDFVMGSRAIKGSKVEARPSWHRKILGRAFCKIRNFIFNLDIKDSQGGLKFFKKAVAKSLFNRQKLKGFGFDVELLFIANKKKYKIKETPVHLLKEHSFKKSKLNPFKDTLKMFLDLLKIRINNFKGCYE